MCLKCGEMLEMTVAKKKKKRERDLPWVRTGIRYLFVSQSFIIRLSAWPLERPRLWFTVSQSSVEWGFCLHVEISQFNEKHLIYFIKSLRACFVILLFWWIAVYRQASRSLSCPHQVVRGMTVVFTASPLRAHNCSMPILFFPTPFIL